MRIDYDFIKILTGTDFSIRKLPLIRADSGRRGPTIWLTAGVHGDEVGSVVIVQEIFRRIRKLGLLSGKLYSFPLMNPVGLETISRKLILTEEDINRCFPGKPNGTLAERIAYKIFSTILETKPDFVIDLHNDWINSIPYVIIDPYPGLKLRQTWINAKNIGFLTNFPVVRENLESIDEMKKTLTFNLLHNGIPSLTIELGGAYILDEKMIITGVEAVWTILVSLKMVKPIPPQLVFRLPKIIRRRLLTYSNKPLTSKSGIIRFFVKPGQIVKKDTAVARVNNIFGKVEEILRAPHDGIVLGYSDSAVVVPGMTVIALGLL